VFAPGILFQPILMFAGKARAALEWGHLKRARFRQASYVTFLLMSSLKGPLMSSLKGPLMSSLKGPLLKNTFYGVQTNCSNVSKCGCYFMLVSP
jgi:hypothetical protein